MKLWQKDFNVKQEVEHFTVGRDRDFDLALAGFDIIGSLAHAAMLKEVGLMSLEELKKVTLVLQEMYADVEKGKFKIEKGFEDIHSQVEAVLTEKTGEAGKKIHTGRSRNDQVLLDLRLFFREEIRKTVLLSKSLFDELMRLSETHKSKLLPGYTHLQLAMPSSFGLWFAAYAESLSDDMLFLQTAYRISNKNPLGSAAGYGSSFPLNRKHTTGLLGFEDMNYNSVYAQMGRGKTEKAVAVALASVAATLAKMAMDVCLYMNQNFGFISFPDELTTGSSIMPHKKNPDVFELIRGKCNRIQALPNELALLLGNLPSGYHRDLQLTKEIIFPAIQEVHDCLAMTSYMLKNIVVKESLLEDEKYASLFSVEVLNEEVQKGTSFREAYKKVAQQIQLDKFKPSTKISHTHEGSIGNLCNAEIQSVMNQHLSEFHFEKALAAEDALLGGRSSKN